MKKFITLALCGAAMLTAGAQKATVDQANKLAGKVDKIEEARALIQQALQNPETANQAETYYVAGKIEWDAYDKQKATQMYDPSKVDPYKMGEELINGFNYFIKVIPLDEKEVKPKYAKKLKGEISKRIDDFYNAGAVLLEEREYYPKAYEAFMIYGDMPEMAELGDKRPEIKDTLRSRAWAYYYAGRAAFSANNVENALNAFRKARKNNFVSYDDKAPNAHVFEITCWQEIEKNDTSRHAEANENVLEIAKDGLRVYGVFQEMGNGPQPYFLNNMVERLTNMGRSQEALSVLNKTIAENPNSSALYALRGWLNDNLENQEAALNDYLAAVELPDVTYPTMRSAIHRLLYTGQTKLNDIDYNDPDYGNKKEQIKNEYIVRAQQLIQKAESMTDDPSDLSYYKENVEYLLGK